MSILTFVLPRQMTEKSDDCSTLASDARCPIVERRENAVEIGLEGCRQVQDNAQGVEMALNSTSSFFMDVPFHLWVMKTGITTCVLSTWPTPDSTWRL